MSLHVSLYLDSGCRGGGVLHWARLLASSPDIAFRMVDAADVLAGRLAGADVLVMPGGGGFERYDSWGEEGCAKIRDFVREGGAYIGTCGGLSVLLNEERRVRMVPFKRDGSPLRGGFMATVQTNSRMEELTGLAPGARSLRYHNGPCPVPAEPIEGCEVETLATYDCTVMERGEDRIPMNGLPAILWATYGRGRMFLFGCHPEVTAANRDLIEGAFRALTGTVPEFPFRRKTDRPRRVAFYCSEIDSFGRTRETVAGALELDARPDVDVVFVTGEELAAGMLEHVDVLVAPALRMAKLPPRTRTQVEIFRKSGGQVVDRWTAPTAG